MHGGCGEVYANKYYTAPDSDENGVQLEQNPGTDRKLYSADFAQKQ